MLPAFVGYYVGNAGVGGVPRRRLAGGAARGLGVGAAVSGGFVAVYAAAGLLISAGLRPLVRYVPWAAVGIGVVLAATGVALVAGRRLALPARERLRPGEGRELRRMVVFGAGYAVASLSCTIAVLLAVVSQALATANLLAMVGVFVAYGAGAATILTGLSLSVAMGRNSVARGLRRALPMAARLGGALLVASGMYLVVYWLPVVTSGRPPSERLSRFSEAPSKAVRTLLHANIGILGIVALGLGAAWIAVALLVWRRRRRSPTEQAAMATTLPPPGASPSGGGGEDDVPARATGAAGPDPRSPPR